MMYYGGIKMIRDAIYMYRKCRWIDMGRVASLVEAVHFIGAERERRKVLGYRWIERISKLRDR